MLKELKVGPYLAPMPVLMIATYNDDGSVDVMNMAWGGICDTDKVALNIGARHRTSKNIAARKAFTISVADEAHMREADYFGIASGNAVTDKFERSGLTATKSSRVDAPVIEEFPLTLECEVVKGDETVSGHRVVGKIVGVLADDYVLDADGKPDIAKLRPLTFDTFHNGYYALGEKVGQAWSDGKGLGE